MNIDGMTGRTPGHSKSAEVRQALRDGEQFTAAEVQEKWDCAASVLNQAVNALRKEGYRRVSQLVPNSKGQHRVGVVLAGRVVRDASSRKDIRNGEEIDVEPTREGQTSIPFPQFGSELKVVGINADRKGEVSVIMRNGKYSWKMIVEGAAAK